MPHSIEMFPYSPLLADNMRNFVVEYSDDGVVWHPLCTVDTAAWAAGVSQTFGLPLAPVGIGTGVAPTLVQFGTLRGDGTMTLASAPTPGNLLVLVMAGFKDPVVFDNYMPNGFTALGLYRSDVNNVVAAAMRRVKDGDAATWAMSASDNQSAVLYEFADAAGVQPVVGGGMSRTFTGADFDIDVPKPLFGSAGVVVGAFTSDTLPNWTIDAADELNVDFETPASGTDNHPGAFFRYGSAFAGNITGNLSASPAVYPAYGLFEVVGTIGGGGGSGDGGGTHESSMRVLQGYGSASTSGYAAKGTRFTLQTDYVATELGFFFSPIPGATYVAGLYELDSSNEIVEVIEESGTLSDFTSGYQPFYYELSEPRVLSAGTRFGVVLTRTDGTGTSGHNIRYASGTDHDYVDADRMYFPESRSIRTNARTSHVAGDAFSDDSATHAAFLHGYHAADGGPEVASFWGASS